MFLASIIAEKIYFARFNITDLDFNDINFSNLMILGQRK